MLGSGSARPQASLLFRYVLLSHHAIALRASRPLSYTLSSTRSVDPALPAYSNSLLPSLSLHMLLCLFLAHFPSLPAFFCFGPCCGRLSAPSFSAELPDCCFTLYTFVPFTASFFSVLSFPSSAGAAGLAVLSVPPRIRLFLTAPPAAALGPSLFLLSPSWPPRGLLLRLFRFPNFSPAPASPTSPSRLQPPHDLGVARIGPFPFPLLMPVHDRYSTLPISSCLTSPSFLLCAILSCGLASFRV